MLGHGARGAAGRRRWARGDWGGLLKEEAPDLEEVARVEESVTTPTAVGTEGAKVGAVDLEGRAPAVRRRATGAHHGRAEREVAHLRLVAPDEAAEELEVAEHAVVERVESPAIEAGAAEEGRGVGRLGAEAEHPGTEALARAVAERRQRPQRRKLLLREPLGGIPPYPFARTSARFGLVTALH